MKGKTERNLARGLRAPHAPRELHALTVGVEEGGTPDVCFLALDLESSTVADIKGLILSSLSHGARSLRVMPRTVGLQTKAKVAMRQLGISSKDAFLDHA